MVQKFVKFIIRSRNRKLFEKIMQDILDDNLDGYDIVKLKNETNYYRLRIGSIRFIFKKTDKGNILIRINNRGDVYKGI